MKQYDHKTIEGRKEIMGQLVEKVAETMCSLYDRWQDEKDYEEFSDYAKAMKKEVGSGFVKATKRPFGFIVQMEGFPYKARVSVNSQSISWSNVGQ